MNLESRIKLQPYPKHIAIIMDGNGRWAKKLGSFNFAMKRILNLLKTKKNRNAYFVCSLTLINEKGKIFNSTYRLQGKISHKILGKNGFGYDSIFIPKGYKKTFGQTTKKKKMRMDHRFYAFKSISPVSFYFIICFYITKNFR